MSLEEPRRQAVRWRDGGKHAGVGHHFRPGCGVGRVRRFGGYYSVGSAGCGGQCGGDLLLGLGSVLCDCRDHDFSQYPTPPADRRSLVYPGGGADRRVGWGVDGRGGGRVLPGCGIAVADRRYSPVKRVDREDPDRHWIGDVGRCVVRVRGRGLGGSANRVVAGATIVGWFCDPAPILAVMGGAGGFVDWRGVGTCSGHDVAGRRVPNLRLGLGCAGV